MRSIDRCSGSLDVCAVEKVHPSRNLQPSEPTLFCAALFSSGRTDRKQVCRLASGKPTKLPLLSPPALWRYERSKSAAAAAIAATNKALALAAATSSSAAPVANGAGFLLTVLTTPRAFLARQRQGIRRIKRRVAFAGSQADRHGTPLGAGGALVCWSLPPSPQRSKRSGSRASAGGSVSTPVSREKRLPSGPGDAFLGKLTPEKVAPGGRAAAAAGVAAGARAGGQEGGGEERHAGRVGVGSGIVGHVWVSLKLRDPSMLLMRVVRQWNMARDEASVQQRRAAQLEAKRWGLESEGGAWAGDVDGLSCCCRDPWCRCWCWFLFWWVVVGGRRALWGRRKPVRTYSMATAGLVGV